MKNSLRVTFRFSFKGVNYDPSSVIDLDRLMEKGADFPRLDFLVANENDIDTYSYLFEVMQQADVTYEDAEGLAADYATTDSFDISGFEACWHEQNLLVKLQAIATEQGLGDFEENEALKQAMLRAYRLN